MRPPPFLDAFDIFGVFEVVLIGGFAQPAALTFRLTRLAAGEFGTKLLMTMVTRIELKQLFAVQTLMLMAPRHSKSKTNGPPK